MQLRIITFKKIMKVHPHQEWNFSTFSTDLENTLVMWWVSEGIIFSLNTVEESEDLLELHASASDSLWINHQTRDWIGMLLLSVCHMIPEACLSDRVAWTSSPSSVAIGSQQVHFALKYWRRTVMLCLTMRLLLLLVHLFLKPFSSRWGVVIVPENYWSKTRRRHHFQAFGTHAWCVVAAGSC